VELLAGDGKDEATPRAGDAPYLGEHRLEVRNVLEHRIRKHQIHALIWLGNGVSRRAVNGGVDAAAPSRLGIDRIRLEPQQRATATAREDHRGEGPISAAEIEDAAVEVNMTKNGFDLENAPEHGCRLKEISRRNPSENVSPFGERTRRAHGRGLTAVSDGRKISQRFCAAGVETSVLMRRWAPVASGMAKLIRVTIPRAEWSFPKSGRCVRSFRGSPPR
jgi:hypothetical protein